MKSSCFPVKILVLAALAFGLLSSNARAAVDSPDYRKYAPDREVDILHLTLDVTPDFVKRTVSGAQSDRPKASSLRQKFWAKEREIFMAAKSIRTPRKTKQETVCVTDNAHEVSGRCGKAVASESCLPHFPLQNKTPAQHKCRAGATQTTKRSVTGNYFGATSSVSAMLCIASPVSASVRPAGGGTSSRS